MPENSKAKLYRIKINKKKKIIINNKGRKEKQG